MRALIACEFSGVVRNAFLARGHDAWSCDLLPSEDGSNRHIRGDARAILNDGWDLLIVAHPPCTRLCNSGSRWLTKPPPGRTEAEMWSELDEGAALFSSFWNAPVDRIAVENPIMHKHAKARITDFRRHKQTIQPWQFGHREMKATCLWLKNLPTLTPTDVVGPPPKEAKARKSWARVHRATPGPDRWKVRARFYPGIAAAMAEQWGDLAAWGDLSRKWAA